MYPDYAGDLPNLQQILLPGAQKMQALAENQGVCVSYCPGGPLLEYMPDMVKNAAHNRTGTARLGEGE